MKMQNNTTEKNPPSLLLNPQDYSEMGDWSGYYKSVIGKGARETLITALSLFKKDGISSGYAIDLAAGEGRDSLEMLGRNWKVLAIDNHPEAFMHLWSRVPEQLISNLTTKQVSFENVKLPECDLINASYALPFCEPKHFNSLWNKITSSIKPGGRFSGQFFGNRDSWRNLPKRSHHSYKEVLNLLNGFTIEKIREEERDDSAEFRNPKHWHVFHVVARKN